MSEETKLPDMAQRVADLEAERDELSTRCADLAARVDEIGAVVERRGALLGAAMRVRDHLRARLAEIEAQEPVAFSKGTNLFWCGDPQDWHGVNCKLYARPIHAIPAGWKLVPIIPTRDQWTAGGAAAREYMEETGRNSPTIIYTAMINAAPEYKA